MSGSSPAGSDEDSRGGTVTCGKKERAFDARREPSIAKPALLAVLFVLIAVMVLTQSRVSASQLVILLAGLVAAFTSLFLTLNGFRKNRREIEEDVETLEKTAPPTAIRSAREQTADLPEHRPPP